MGKRLTPIQVEALTRALAEDGLLVNVPGGYWTTTTIRATWPSGEECKGRWHAPTQTVYALERAGYLARAPGQENVQAYRATRIVTDAGRAALRAASR